MFNLNLIQIVDKKKLLQILLLYSYAVEINVYKHPMKRADELYLKQGA